MKATTVGVLNDRNGTERRVALVPDAVGRLARLGLHVVVESGAGAGASYPDDAYVAAGASIAGRGDVLTDADIVVCVHRPGSADHAQLHQGQVVIGMLGPRTDPEGVSAMAGRGVIAVSLDCLPRTVSRAQAMDALTSQANVAGYRAVLLAATAFGRFFPMLITAAGTSRPASVLIIGAGVAGLSAVGTARRLGAVVTGYDVRPETRAEIESLGARVLELDGVGPAAGTGGYARALAEDERQAQQDALAACLPGFDVVITTAQVPGRRPPVLLTASGLAGMRAGSVVVDLAASALGGNVEGSLPDEQVNTPQGVTVIGAADAARQLPVAASDALSHNMTAVIGALVADGELRLDLADDVLSAIVLSIDGHLTHPPSEITTPANARGSR